MKMQGSRLQCITCGDADGCEPARIRVPTLPQYWALSDSAAAAKAAAISPPPPPPPPMPNRCAVRLSDNTCKYHPPPTFAKSTPQFLSRRTKYNFNKDTWQADLRTLLTIYELTVQPWRYLLIAGDFVTTAVLVTMCSPALCCTLPKFLRALPASGTLLVPVSGLKGVVGMPKSERWSPRNKDHAVTAVFHFLRIAVAGCVSQIATAAATGACQDCQGPVAAAKPCASSNATIARLESGLDVSGPRKEDLAIAAA